MGAIDRFMMFTMIVRDMPKAKAFYAEDPDGNLVHLLQA
jgi:hypothetical protein